MAYIEWENSFELGVEDFDEHHKQLVSLINKSYYDYITEAPSEEVGAVLEKLIDYASYHFSEEELWMGKQNFPSLNHHSAEHFKFKNKLIILNNKYRQGKQNLSLDIFVFLKTWLTDHILKTDSEYKKFFDSKQSFVMQ